MTLIENVRENLDPVDELLKLQGDELHDAIRVQGGVAIDLSGCTDPRIDPNFKRLDELINNLGGRFMDVDVLFGPGEDGQTYAYITPRMPRFIEQLDRLDRY